MIEKDWRQDYEERLTTAEGAVSSAIRNGQHIVFGHAAAAPEAVSQELFRQRARLRDVEVFHMLYFGEGWHLRSEMKGHVKVVSNFFDGQTRKAYREGGDIDFLPCHFHELPEMLRSGIYRVDVAAVQLSLPNEDGYCSFGISCDYTKTAAEVAPIVIAEVNKQMPFIGGDNLIHISELDHIIEVDRPLYELPQPKIGEVEARIAQHCVSLIPNGATLQLGIGAIPDAILQQLVDHKDLGIHTEMFTDGVMHMMRKGVINGSKKTKYPNKVITTLIMGSKELYDFLDHNEAVEAYPVNETNDPYKIGENDHMISLNSCLEIDLMGQVASEAIGLSQFSGTGGQVDFLRGARKSKGGVSILAFPATAKNGTVSRIVPILEAGTIVTTARQEIDYIATEYGIVRLRGLSIRDRARALISIAAPQFRDELEDAYNKLYIY